MTSAQTVSVIVPVYNGGANWVRALDALQVLAPAPLEILVVDDGSTDESAIYTRARGLTLLRTDYARRGPAAARNLGAQHARGEIVFFLDADVVVSSDAIARIVRALADETVSAVFGSYDDAPTSAGLVSQYKNLQHHYVHQNSARQATTFWAGCGALRRDIFLQVGGFDVRYTRPSIEDIELGYRLARAGKTILLLPDLQVKHLKRWTLRTWLVTEIRDRAIPWSQLLLQQQTVPRDLNLDLTSRVSAVLCWAGLLFFMAALFFPVLGWVGAGALLGVGALNFEFYRFLYTKRGVWFTLCALPLHWLYYIYSSASFGSIALYARLRV